MRRFSACVLTRARERCGENSLPCGRVRPEGDIAVVSGNRRCEVRPFPSPGLFRRVELRTQPLAVLPCQGQPSAHGLRACARFGASICRGTRAKWQTIAAPTGA